MDLLKLNGTPDSSVRYRSVSQHGTNLATHTQGCACARGIRTFRHDIRSAAHA